MMCCCSLFKAYSEGLLSLPASCSSQLCWSFSSAWQRLLQALQTASSPKTFQPKLRLGFSSQSFLRAFRLRQSLCLSSPLASTYSSAYFRFFSHYFFFIILWQFTSFQRIYYSRAALLFATCAQFIFSFSYRYWLTLCSPSRYLSFAEIQGLSQFYPCSLFAFQPWSGLLAFSYYSCSSLLSKSAKFFSQASNLSLQLQASFGSSPSERSFRIACWSLIILSLASLICWKTSFLKGSNLKKPLKSSISPQSMMIIGQRGLSSLSIGTFEIFLTTSMPSITCPKTTCFPSKCGHALSVMKNCEEFVLRPQLAIESSPAQECALEKFSSTKVRPQMEQPPLPPELEMSPLWSTKPSIMRWNLVLRQCNLRLLALPYYPVQRPRKFQEVLGVRSLKSQQIILPAPEAPICTSMYTRQFALELILQQIITPNKLAKLQKLAEMAIMGQKWRNDHFSKCLIFLLCLNSFISASQLLFFSTFSAVWWLMSFLSSLILIQLSLSSFSFSLSMSSFFSSSTRFCMSSPSMAWILSFQLLSVYLRSFSSSAIWSSSCWMISLVTTLEGIGCGFFVFSLLSFIFCYIYFILACFVIQTSWFFLSTRSFSISFQERCLHSYLDLAICSFSDLTFSQYSLSFLMSFKALVCSRLTLSKASFSSCRTLRSFCRFLSSSSLPCTPRLSQTCSSCRLVRKILFLRFIIQICCFLSSAFLAFMVSSSQGYSACSPYFFDFFQRWIIQSICLASSQIWVFSFMFCSIIFSLFPVFSQTFLPGVAFEFGVCGCEVKSYSYFQRSWVGCFQEGWGSLACSQTSTVSGALFLSLPYSKSASQSSYLYSSYCSIIYYKPFQSPKSLRTNNTQHH